MQQNFYLRGNFRLIFEQICMLMAGGIAGSFSAQAVDGKWWQIEKILYGLFLFLVLALLGLGYGLSLIYELYRMINMKRRLVAVYAPYEIENEKSSSWVDIPLSRVISCLKKSGLPTTRIRTLFPCLLCPIIVNPYGGAFPENNMRLYSSLEQIIDWVQSGGIFINIADIPFYYARTPLQKRLIDTTPIAGPFDLQRSFHKSLLTERLGIAVYNMHVEDNIDRVFRVADTVTNLWRKEYSYTLAEGVHRYSPFIALPYGEGYFVFSSIRITKELEDHLIIILSKSKHLIENTKT